MTTEEALKETLRRKEIAEMTAEKEVVEYYGIVAEALEKQTPKKPLYINEHDTIYFDWQCPNCKREYVNSAYGINHCVDCGQLIDWIE